MRGIILAALLCAALGGCTFAEWNSINRQFNPSMGDSRLIDAKQRAIISLVRTEIVRKNGQMVTTFEPRVCAEPSPDALQATAAALAGEAESEKLATILRGSVSSSDSASNIGLRTQSIQLLRDAYYRLCEGYMNGAIDSLALQTLQKRFQNHMVALLAVEQLTGAVAAFGGNAGGSAASDAGANISLISRNLATARDRLATEKAEAARTEAALKAANEAEPRDEQAIELAQGNHDGQLANVRDAEKEVALLETAYRNAAEQTINSSASASASGASISRSARTGELPAHVSAAVAGITIAALKDDDSPELCLEFARAAVTDTSTAKFLAENPKVYATLTDPDKGGYLLKQCDAILTAHAKGLQSVADSAETKRQFINNLGIGLKQKGSRISGAEAIRLVEAVNRALPSVPGAAYIPAPVTPACGTGQSFNGSTGKCE